MSDNEVWNSSCFPFVTRSSPLLYRANLSIKGCVILVAAARGMHKRKSHNLLERNMLCAAELWVVQLEYDQTLPSMLFLS